MNDIEVFRTETRQWLEANCPQSMRQPITADDMVWASSKLSFRSDDQRLWFERMRDRGWFAPGWPRDYGGGGLDARQQRVLDEEMRRLGCRQPQYSFGVWMLGPVLLEFGTDGQKREHLVPITHGRVRWCQGFSEPNAGSDLASLKTSAQPVDAADGPAFVVNGSKIWTSYGDRADWMYALVRTDASVRKQAGISFLLIDMRSPGVTVKPIELISGKSNFCAVFFDNVRVPARQLVGKLNDGWTVGKRLLQFERAAMSRFTEGGAPSLDALAVAREAFKGAPGGAPAELRVQLAKVLMDAQAFALTHRRVTEEALAGMDVGATAAIMKLVQTEQEIAKDDLLVRLLGQRGLAWEGDAFSALERNVCRDWLRSRTYTIGGGTSEIQLNIIAKHVLGLPA